MYSSVMFVQNIALAIGGNSTSYEYAQDFDLIIKIALSHEWRSFLKYFALGDLLSPPRLIRLDLRS